MPFDPDKPPATAGDRRAAREWLGTQLRVDMLTDREDFIDLTEDWWDNVKTPRYVAENPWLAALARDTALYNGAQAMAAMQILLDWCDGREADPADIEALSDLSGNLLYEKVRHRFIRLGAIPNCEHSLEHAWCDCLPASPETPDAFRRYDFDQPPSDGWTFQVAFWWICQQLGVAVADISPAAAKAGHLRVQELYGPLNMCTPRDIIEHPTVAYELRELLTEG